MLINFSYNFIHSAFFYFYFSSVLFIIRHCQIFSNFTENCTPIIDAIAMKSYPAVKTSLLLALGILLGRAVPVSFSYWISIAVPLLLLVCLYFFWNPHIGKRYITALIVIAAGWMRFNMIYWSHANHIIHLPKDEVFSFKAHLVKDPEYWPDKTVYWIATDSVSTNREWLPVCGRLRMNRYRKPLDSLFYGEQILITGTFALPASRRNPGGFDYRSYLLARGVSGLFIPAKETVLIKTGQKMGHRLLRQVVYPVRRWIKRRLESIYAKESEYLLKALILGDRTDLSDEIKTAFAKTGTIHVLAVSGLHVGFVLLILYTLFSLIRLPCSWRTLLTVLGLIFYCLLTEGKPPVVRATIMACVYLIGQQLERQSHPFNSLGVAGLLLLIINPLMLFDTGFQLSFSAVFSILYFYPKWATLPGFRQCHAWCMKRRLIRNVCVLLLVSLSAQLGTLPVVISVFHQLPLFGILSNLFAVPLVGLIVAYGLTSLFFAPVSLWAAEIYSAFTDILIRLLLWMTEMVQAVPFLNIVLPAPNCFQITLYLCLLFLFFQWTHPLWRKRLVFASLICINLTIWHAAFTCSATKMTYIQLDVGQGDAAVIHLPRHRTVIIDGGDRHAWFDSGERILVPYLHQKGIRKIDAVILTHAHNDHVGGLISLINQCQVGLIVTGDTLASTKPMRKFLETAYRKQIPLKRITALDSLIFPGSACYFLSPDQTMQNQHNVNNRSVVSLFLFGEHRMLCMGDAEFPVENHLVQSIKPLDADVIKIGHHGSHTASNVNFLKTVHPKHAIISAGKNNRFGHPDSTTVRKLSELKISIYRTDLDGAVIFQSDGKTLFHKGW